MYCCHTFCLFNKFILWLFLKKNFHVSGATAHGIVLLGGGVTVGLHLLVHGVSAGRLHPLVQGATAGRHHHRLRETTAGHHQQPEY